RPLLCQRFNARCEPDVAERGERTASIVPAVDRADATERRGCHDLSAAIYQRSAGARTRNHRCGVYGSAQYAQRPRSGDQDPRDEAGVSLSSAAVTAAGERLGQTTYVPRQL